ncbi:MAG: TolC family protein [Ignavibacteriae bacterium]|nr:TolC family protein [Ignavibacteriota bacterium]
MKRRFLLLVLGLVLATAALAQQKLTLTIDQAIQTGLQNSKMLHTARFKQDAADARASEMQAAALPALKFNAAYTRLSDVPSQGFVMPANTFGPGFPPAPVNVVLSPTILDNYTLRATVQQPIWTGGKISGAIEAAQEAAVASGFDVKKDRADLIFNITAAYWNLFRAREAKAFVDTNVAQVKAHLTDAENLQRQGMITTNDLMKVQVQLSDAQVRAIDADNMVRMALYGLNNTLGLPLQTEITLASTMQRHDRTYASIDTLVERAMNNRPELAAMQARVRASEAGVTAARGGWWPQLALVGNYNYLNPNQRYFPLKKEFKDSWDVSVSLSFDIWNWLQTANQSAQATAQLSQAREGLAMMGDGVMLEVTQNYLGIQKARERATVSEKGVAQAEENYRITKGKFVQGMAANSELLDAEVALLQSRLNLVQSKVDYELAVAGLTRAIGE